MPLGGSASRCAAPVGRKKEKVEGAEPAAAVVGLLGVPLRGAMGEKGRAGVVVELPTARVLGERRGLGGWC